MSRTTIERTVIKAVASLGTLTNEGPPRVNLVGSRSI
jgi:hypothetical protein